MIGRVFSVWASIEVAATCMDASAGATLAGSGAAAESCVESWYRGSDTRPTEVGPSGGQAPQLAGPVSTVSGCARQLALRKSWSESVLATLRFFARVLPERESGSCGQMKQP